MKSKGKWHTVRLRKEVYAAVNSMRGYNGCITPSDVVGYLLGERKEKKQWKKIVEM